MSLADAFVRSGFFKDTTDQAQAIVKIVAGQELGIPPIAAMTGINIVQGRVNLSANILASLVKRHPVYDYKIITQTDDVCEIEFSADGEPLGVSSFTMTDAAAAGLAGKDNWNKYPRNMLFARAMSNGVKWYCPDVTAGMPVYTPDEMGRDVDAEGNAIPTVPETSTPLWATNEQKVQIKELLKVTFPRIAFENEGHYNYVLKHNGHPKLGELTYQQAQDLIDDLTPESTPEPTITPESEWLFGDERLHKKLWIRAGELGLDREQVHKALGVEHVADYCATFDNQQEAYRVAVEVKLPKYAELQTTAEYHNGDEDY